jgi:hypothetical protein
MDSGQPTTNIVVVPSNPGVFGTRIPSSVAFIVGILLFFLPFSEIKCGGTTFANKSGLDFATGKDWRVAGKANMFGQNDLKEKSMAADQPEKGNTQIFAIAAAALAFLGLLTCFIKGRAAGTLGLLTGLLSAGALVALMMEAKKLFNDSMSKQAMDKTNEGADMMGLNKLANTVAISFTPWFFVAVVVLIAAAVFSFMRTRSAT